MDSIVASIDQFFQNGIEGYNPLTKETLNPGGARLYWQKDWKFRTNIHINDQLFNAIKDFPSSLYVISRIRLDEKGNPLHAKKGMGLDRQTLGLMLYSQFNRVATVAQNHKEKILKEFPDITGYVWTGKDLEAQIPSIKKITEVMYYTPQQTLEPIRLEGCVFLILPSGSKGSAQLWGYNTKEVANRERLNQQTTVSGEDVDLSNLPV